MSSDTEASAACRPSDAEASAACRPSDAEGAQASRSSTVFCLGEILSEEELEETVGAGIESLVKLASFDTEHGRHLSFSQIMKTVNVLFRAVGAKLRAQSKQAPVRGDIFFVSQSAGRRYRNDQCFIAKSENEVEELASWPDDYGCVPKDYTLAEFGLEHFANAIEHNRLVVLPSLPSAESGAPASLYAPEDLVVDGTSVRFKGIPIKKGCADEPLELTADDVDALVRRGPNYLYYEANMADYDCVPIFPLRGGAVPREEKKEESMLLFVPPKVKRSEKKRTEGLLRTIGCAETSAARRRSVRAYAKAINQVLEEAIEELRAIQRGLKLQCI